MGHETVIYVTILCQTCVCFRFMNSLKCHIRSADAFFLKRIFICDGKKNPSVLSESWPRKADKQWHKSTRKHTRQVNVRNELYSLRIRRLLV